VNSKHSQGAWLRSHSAKLYPTCSGRCHKACGLIKSLEHEALSFNKAANSMSPMPTPRFNLICKVEELSKQLYETMPLVIVLVMLMFNNVKMVQNAGYQQQAMNNQGTVIAHFQPSPPHSTILGLWYSKTCTKWIANVVMSKGILQRDSS
jgi:hypothetical protein